MTSVYGELEDGCIVLSLPGADDWQLQAAATLLHSMTPLLETRPDGNLQVSCSWVAVTQLSHMFNGKPDWNGDALQWTPGPMLSAWIIEEILRRSCEGELVGEKPRREPMSHQSAGALAIGMNGRFLLADEMGPQPITTPVLTPEGWTELGRLKPGDYVYSVDGEATRVEEIKFFGRQPVYRITLSDRSSTLATANHRWAVYGPNDRFWNTSRVRPRAPKVLSTEELLHTGLFTYSTKTPTAKWFLPPQPVICEGADASGLPVAPYLYGALLGDGSIGTPENLSFTSNDDDMLLRVSAEAEGLGTTSRQVESKKYVASLHFHKKGSLQASLAELDAFHLASGKYVHPSYLAGSEEVRRELLQGLLDTDGHAQKGTGLSAEFVSVSPRLAADVAFLGRSLGAVVTEAEAQPAGYVNAAGHRVTCQDKYRVYLRFPADAPSPFWCERKRSRWDAQRELIQRKVPSRSIRSIDPEGEAAVCCIRVKSSAHLYLTDTALIPTHNTGKSGSGLLGIAEMDKRGRSPWPVLIVCPASVVDSWLEEIDAWYPMWRARAYRGPRRTSYLGSADLYVMSYETMRNDVGDSKKPGPLMKMDARTIIFDEAHKLCNYDSQQSVRARRLAKKIPNVVAMTGTPITKNVGNFWPILNSMYPESYPSRDRYKNRYCLMRNDTQYGQAEVTGLNPDREPEFRIVMQGTMRRVAKIDVMKELPPKTYQTRWIDIPAKYRPAYDEMQEDMLAHLPDVETPLTAMSTLAKMMRLSQLAHSACDCEIYTELDVKEGSETFGQEVEKLRVTPKLPCWKGDALLEIMEELHQDTGLPGTEGYKPGVRPVVAFAPLKQLVMLAAAMAAKKGYKVGYIVGGMSDKQRTDTRLAFQDNQYDLLAVTTGAGGVGLTLTASSDVVFLARPWSFVEAAQAEDRCHRRGQTDHVQVYDLVTRNSIEARVRSALRDKASALSDLVRDRRIVEGFLGGKLCKYESRSPEKYRTTSTLNPSRRQGFQEDIDTAPDRCTSRTRSAGRCSLRGAARKRPG
jgi:SNF2-related domain/Helicase conserved C-terminal domain